MSKKSRIALPLLGALLLAGCTATPDENFAKAEHSFSEQDYAAARVHLASALRGEPDNPAMLALYARTQLELADGQGARTTLDKLAQLGKLPEDAAHLYGQAFLLIGNYAEALKRIGNPSTTEGFRLKALAHVGLEDRKEAAAAFEQGGKAAGTKARLNADHARFLLSGGDLATARKLADAALAEAPDMLEALVASGLVASAQGQPAQALAAFDKALVKNPGNRAALIGKAGALGDLGRMAEMDPLLKTAAGIFPDDPDITFMLARVAAEKKDWAKARTILQKKEMQLNERPEAQILYAQALLHTGQVEMARGRLTPLVRQYPAHRLARRVLAETQLAGGDGAAAFATIQPVTRLADATVEELALAARAAKASGAPGADALAARAQFPTAEALASDLANADAAMKARNWKAAIAAYERILAVTDGKNVLVQNNMAIALSEAGDRKRALGHALAALALAPDNPSVMDTAGWLMFQTGGDRAKALSLLRRAATLAPDNATIAEHLARAEKG